MLKVCSSSGGVISVVEAGTDDRCATGKDEDEEGVVEDTPAFRKYDQMSLCLG